MRKLNSVIGTYFMERRLRLYNKGTKLKLIKFRHFQKYHGILLFILKVDRILKKEKIVVISDERKKTDKPIIFACTHCGGCDIERAFESMKTPAYLFFGDPTPVYLIAPGIIMHLNGAICVELRNKSDRKVAKYRASEVLQNGGNLIIFPEGAWNVTHNLPVMKLFKGSVDLAIANNANIIPVAIEQYDDTYYISFGKNIDCTNYKAEQSIETNNLLRDSMCTLKWKIWESQPVQSRREIAKEYADYFSQSIIDRDERDSGTLQDVYETRFNDKNIVEFETAFKHLTTIIPNQNNAFLFNKRLT